MATVFDLVVSFSMTYYVVLAPSFFALFLEPLRHFLEGKNKEEKKSVAFVKK